MSHLTRSAIAATQAAAAPSTGSGASGEQLAPRRAPLVVLRFRPSWAYIDGIREFGRTFCATSLDDPEAAERARVILQELLEIAVRGATASRGIELELELTLRDGRPEVAVTRQADPEQRVLLEGAVAWVNASAPEAIYLSALRAPAGGPASRTRLGLARVRLEGKAELVLEALDDGRLRLRARGQP